MLRALLSQVRQTTTENTCLCVKWYDMVSLFYCFSCQNTLLLD